MKVHPAADIFPMMNDEELQTLAADIEENGLPWETRKRVTMEKATARHFRGWLTVQAKNHAAQAAAFARMSEKITGILDQFQEHPECKTWGALKKLNDKTKPHVAASPPSPPPLPEPDPLRKGG